MTRSAVLAAAVVVLAPSGSARALTYTVPGVARAPGLNGTVWVTELRARNATPVPADITVTFAGSGPEATWTRHLKPYESIVVPEVLGRLFGLSEAVGTLRID